MWSLTRACFSSMIRSVAGRNPWGTYDLNVHIPRLAALGVRGGLYVVAILFDSSRA